MSFLAHLESVVSQVEGALACSIMGFDGIAIETHQVDLASELELTNAWLALSIILHRLRRAAYVLKTGQISEVSSSTEKVITLMRLVSPEYFIVLALTPSGNYGKGRYVLRLTAPKVKAEL